MENTHRCKEITFFKLRCDTRPYPVWGVSSSAMSTDQPNHWEPVYQSGQKGCVYCRASECLWLFLFISLPCNHSVLNPVSCLCYQIKKGMNWVLHMTVNTCDQKEYHFTLSSSLIMCISCQSALWYIKDNAYVLTLTS